MRAFDPFPGASSALGSEDVKCWRGTVVDGAGSPGQILAASEQGITVACGTQALRLTELQRPGGKRLAAGPFLRGKPIDPGMAFTARGD